MRNRQVGNKADLIAVVVHNADTVSIPAGSPVVLNGNGTNDGLDVVLPATSGALLNILGGSHGITTKTLAVGDYGDAIVYGFHPSVTLEINSRANSGASWSTQAAFSGGQFLSIDTVANLLVTYAATVGINTNSLTNNALGTYYTQPIAVLLGGSSGTGSCVASQAASASSTADTRVYITASVHAFIRMM
jgi:hypothetical protein